ncbi:MAG TPA: ABC transporter ATP-binding protein, partial [Prolixibacteraceae bacterium]
MIQEEKIIALNDAAIGYKSKAHAVNVVKSGISVYALKGELVALIGGNGVGKSTLLRTIAGFQPSIGGDVLIREKQVNSYREKELALIMSFVST